jgi:hypothetical protein
MPCSFFSPLLFIILGTIPVHADELIDDITAGKTAPGCGVMIHKPASPVPEIDGKHQTFASMTVHGGASGGLFIQLFL